MTVTFKNLIRRRRVFAAAAISIALFAFTPAATLAADWPDGDLRLIVPYAPGGTTDNIARALVPALEKALDTSIVIENVSGAGGTIGVKQLTESEGDGQIFGLLPTATVAIAPTMRKVGYDPLTDLVPVASVVESIGALAVRKDFPAQTLDELIAYARENPGEMTFGSAGIGSITHLYVEIFAREAGIEVNHVPFNGSSEAINNLVGGHIDGQMDPVVLRQAQAGSVKPIAILNNQRWDGLPDVPTLTESGFDGLRGVSSWWGIFAPAGTPQEAIEGMAQGVAEALQDQETLSRFADLGVMPIPMPQGAFAEMTLRNVEQYKPVLKELELAN